MCIKDEAIFCGGCSERVIPEVRRDGDAYSKSAHGWLVCPICGTRLIELNAKQDRVSNDT